MNVTRPLPLHLALPQSLPGPVELRETHVSWVLLTDRAFKLKKPCASASSTSAPPSSAAVARPRSGSTGCSRRRSSSASALLIGPDEVRMGQDAECPAVDWVVQMRRFDEDSTMAARAAWWAPWRARCRGSRGGSPPSMPPPSGRSGDLPDQVLATWRNINELRPGARTTAGVGARRAASPGFRHPPQGRPCLPGRRRASSATATGTCARSTWCSRDGVTIVDRLEFDPASPGRRGGRPGLPVMDLKRWRLLRPSTGRRLPGGRRRPGDDALWPSSRHTGRSSGRRSALLRSRQRTDDPQRAHADEHAAARLIRLAERMTRSARGRHVLLIHGPPASGKTWLATALSACSGLPVIATDAVRKELLGVPAGRHAPEAAYEPAERRRVYAEVGSRAAAALERGSVIVDATLGDPAVRDALPPSRPPPPAWSRSAVRPAARRSCAARLNAPAEPGSSRMPVPRRSHDWPEPSRRSSTPAQQRHDVDTERDVEDVIDEIAVWFDHRLLRRNPPADLRT